MKKGKDYADMFKGKKAFDMKEKAFSKDKPAFSKKKPAFGGKMK